MEFNIGRAIATIGVVALLGTIAACSHPEAQRSGFHLTSPEIADGATMKEEQVFDGQGCTGANVSPSLQWSGAPAGTKSFAIMLFDPDAPNGGWFHWTVYNIPASSSSLAKGVGSPGKTGLPPGSRQTFSDFLLPGYGGPCPPPGSTPHHYVLTVYALDTEKLAVPIGASNPTVRDALPARTLAKASVTGVYRRDWTIGNTK